MPVPTLAPGQSATTTFTLTVPATALQGSYQLIGTARAQAPGGRVTMQNSASFQLSDCCTVTLQRVPGSTVEVKANFSNVLTATSETLTARDVTLSLDVPSGLTATATTSTTVASVPPGGTASAVWAIAGPAANTPGAVQATASYTVDGMTQTISSASGYLSLAAAYNNTGISDNSNPSSANIDGDGDSFSEQSLEAAGLSPGATVTEQGLSYTWPDVPAGQPDNVETTGQTLLVNASGSTLGFLGMGDFGEQSATATVTYTDGTTQPFTLTYPDWFTDSVAGTSDQLVATGVVNGTSAGHQVGVYAAEVPLESGKTIAAITLPNDSHVHVFATSIR